MSHGKDIANSCFKCCGKERVMSEEEKLYTTRLPHFDLAGRSSQLLVAIYSNLLYSSGIPWLMPILCCTLMASYLTDKYMLLRRSRKPPYFGPEIIQGMMSRLTAAALLHSLFGFWMFSKYYFQHETGGMM